MDKPRFELYAFWRTSATYRVRVAMNLKSLAFDEHFIDLDKGEQRAEGFLKINPLGAIPALRDNHEPPGEGLLTQSLAILEFLDEIAPKPPLLPADPYGRARVRSLAAMLAVDTHPLVVPRVRQYLTSVNNFDDAAWRAWQTHWFSTGLHALETRLAADSRTGKFSHGNAVTMADICLASILVVMRIFKIKVDDIPIVTRIMEQCEQEAAFVMANPMRQTGAPG